MATRKQSQRLKKLGIILLVVIVAGCLVPAPFAMPVKGASAKSYSQHSYWFYPWGKSVTHKGVDIFAKRTTPVSSATHGIVIFTGNIKTGGNVVLILGPKWRLHYYAHLDSINTSIGSLVSLHTKIGTVGATGNAAGKPAHLHYTIRTIIPYPWQIDKSKQGWKKMFYINPIPYLNHSVSTAN
jgi:murein DD-endopeptidase MepM/ murein hydrolase activator NlpD